MSFLLVGIGGGIGAISRSIISGKWNTGDVRIPFGTWVANMTGSVVLALLILLHRDHVISDQVWLFTGVGFCGAYTTFSTFGKETVMLIFAGQLGKALMYVSLSLFTSLLTVGLSLYLL